LKRRAGREPVRYAHPLLEADPRRTLGVPLFQEQLLRMAMTVALHGRGGGAPPRDGFKRSVERMGTIEQRLRDGMAARGISAAGQEEIVQQIHLVRAVRFRKARSQLSRSSPTRRVSEGASSAAFACALLNAWPMGFYHRDSGEGRAAPRR